MKLSIVIVSWNTKDLLDACLRSIYAYPLDQPFEVWVVDNKSSDDTVAMVQEHFPQVELIASEENLGFAGGNNRAIPHCQGEYVLLLNPDTEVKPEALNELVAFMDTHPEAGAAGSRLLNADETLQPSCHPRPTLSREFWRMFYLDKLLPYGSYDMSKWNLEQPREVDVLMGASMLLRKTVLDTIGLLDEGYFMYSEEVDLCFRLQKAGWHLFWVPQSQVVHYWGQSAKQVLAEMFLQLYRGKLRFFRKHYGGLTVPLYKVVLGLAALLRLGLAPFVWLRKSDQSGYQLHMARHYGRLLISLPSM
ncbi:MAG: glycosyltransferase family 2 protein [Ardenticatenaceae bacterium]|nr:glycosyltransferase family 2 protein [Anaerolineales bacterium]MCB9009703.1 glycosyltransferase family 2 protein [Ardenticatenaceae bacterium]